MTVDGPAHRGGRGVASADGFIPDERIDAARGGTGRSAGRGRPCSASSRSRADIRVSAYVMDRRRPPARGRNSGRAQVCRRRSRCGPNAGLCERAGALCARSTRSGAFRPRAVAWSISSAGCSPIVRIASSVLACSRTMCAREETLRVLRGRLRLMDQVRHQYGRIETLECAYEELRD